MGFSPPRLLVRIWSLREEQALSAAMTELVAAESTAEVTDVLLPAIGRLVGAEALALRALSGFTAAPAIARQGGGCAVAPRDRLPRGDV